MTKQFAWAASDIPAHKKIGEFAQYIEQLHLGWELRAHDPSLFDASIKGHMLEDIRVTDVTAEPVFGHREKHWVSRGNQDYYAFFSVVEGEEYLTQGGNESVLSHGDISVWNTGRPASFSSNRRVRQVSLLAPGSLVERRIPNIEDFCGRRIDGTTGFGRLLRSCFQELPQMVSQIDDKAVYYLTDPVFDLINGAISACRNVDPNSRYRKMLMQRIKTFIFENIDNPDLGPSVIAREFGFSPRYLHRIFSENGATVAGFIRQQRLLNAKVDLSKPGNRSLSIMDVAFKYGFSDASHFSKAFRQEFGVSPRQFRQSLHS